MLLERAKLGRRARARPTVIGKRRGKQPAVRRLIIARLRFELEARARQRLQLSWDEMLPALERIDALPELIKGIDDPDALLGRLRDAATPAARRLAMAQLRGPLEPHLLAHEPPLAWTDVEAALANAPRVRCFEAVPHESESR